MTRLILAFAILHLFLSIEAQNPEPVYGFAREQKPLTWYKEQAIAWKKEVDKNPKDANAWYYYFRVKKNLANVDTIDKRPRKEKWNDLKQIVEDMAVNVPNSYEFNYCKFSYEGNNFDYLSYLKKADELSNGRTLHIDYMVNWGEVERNMERRDKYCKQWYASGEFSPGLLYYNHNVIAGTKPNAIIFTAGDNDTYPIWLLQSQGIRKDITVLNLYLLQINDYRAKVFKELGIAPYDMPKQSSNHDSNELIQKKFEKEIIKHVAANKKNYPVYVSVTACGPGYLKPVEADLYLTGLTYIYSKETIDNMALLKRNFEQNYTLDYIEKPFFKDISADRVKATNGNYVIPMLKLFDHYRESGDTQRADWIKQKLVYIAEGSADKKDILKHLEQ